MECVVFSQLEGSLKDELLRTAHRVGETAKQEDLNSFTNKLADELTEKASSMCDNFKYIVNCTVSEGTGGNHVTQGSCAWDPELDGVITFTLKKNNYLILVTLFGIAL
jgi:hypothetical protein